MICIHHNDMDGRCAAAIVWKACGDSRLKMVEMDYKMQFDVESVSPGEGVIIVDFSLPPADMARLLERTQAVVWIDHHVTAQAYPYQHLEGLRDFTEKGRSGAELTWRYFYPSEKPPHVVDIVGSYDSWRHDIPGDNEFHEGMKLGDNMGPIGIVWRRLLAEESYLLLRHIISNGSIAIAVRDSYCSEMAKAFGYTTLFEGLHCYVMNVYRYGSQMFGEKIKQYDACIAFAYDGKKFTVSMYSGDDKPIVNQVCKKYGGGGHNHAAGFICEKLPFERSEF